MAKKPYITWIPGMRVRALHLLEQIRDNGNELWKYEVAGDMIYATSGSTTARLAIGSTGQILTVTSGSPTWKPIIATRQGGHATAWNVAGTNNYTPTTMQILLGVAQVTITNGNTNGSTTVWFPGEFAYNPHIKYSYLVAGGSYTPTGINVLMGSITSASFNLTAWCSPAAAGDIIFYVHWEAKGAV